MPKEPMGVIQFAQWPLLQFPAPLKEGQDPARDILLLVELKFIEPFSMAQILFLLTLLSYCSGVRSQPTVSQPASQSVSPGQTVTLSCTRSSDGSWDSDSAWYQQKPGETPRFVFYGTSIRGPGIQDRFTASKSGSVAHLTIKNVQPEDEAVYHCSVYYYTDSMFVFGSGTDLEIAGQPHKAPSISVFPPSCEELQRKKTGTVVCLVDKFYPKALTITWTVDGNEQTDGVKTAMPTKRGDNYMASSYLTMSESEWRSHDVFVCKVSHDGKTYEKSVKRSECSG